MRSLIVAALVAVIGAAGCATGGTGNGSSSGSRNHITNEELSDPMIQTLTAFEAIQRLRPRWLRSRASGSGGTQTLPVVYLNGSRYGNTSSLQAIDVGDIEEMRFINSRDATTRYGTGVPGGVIAIETRR